MGEGETGLPFGNHPGAFGFVRKNHIHEGVDLYCKEGTEVSAVEDGVIVAVIDFTGGNAVPPSPWWHDTKAILVEGESGVVVYGEINPAFVFWPGDQIFAGELIGHVTPVLKKDKGRPMTMLHIELHRPGTRDAFEWPVEGPRPASLLDPTPRLMEATCRAVLQEMKAGR
jgi:murein DD-endopeptidase MepM/ murein hydrolase activator NlpD